MSNDYDAGCNGELPVAQVSKDELSFKQAERINISGMKVYLSQGQQVLNLEGCAGSHFQLFEAEARRLRDYLNKVLS